MADEVNADASAVLIAKKKKRRRLFGAIAILLLVLIGLGIGGLDRAREKARRMNCAGNLKCMGLAFIMYAGDDVENGYFPSSVGNDLSLLSITKYLVDGKIYGCPSHRNPSAQSADSDYIFVGSGLKDTNKSPTATPLVFENPGNHNGEWVNVMFIDGHVTGYAAGDWQALFKQHGLPLTYEQR